MKEILFISDLHLSVHTTRLNALFKQFLDEKAAYCDSLYILGDFFEYWLGDDLMGPWEHSIACMLKQVADNGVKIFFLHGNRDFLVGEVFLKKANCRFLSDPSIILLDNQRILLKHGDDLCTLDRLHQCFRRFTRNRVAKKLFLSLTSDKRGKIAAKIREKSTGRQFNKKKMQVVDAAIVKELQRHDASFLIHGHTHQPMVRYCTVNKMLFEHIVLPDWGQSWGYLCYNKSNRFELVLKRE